MMVRLRDKSQRASARDRRTQLHIESLQITSIPPIEDVDFYCDERVNLFVGPNASGKSTILRLIEYIHVRNQGEAIDHVPSPHPRFRPNPHDFLGLESPYCKLGASIDWPRNDDDEPIWNRIPLVYMPSTRVTLPPAFPVVADDNGPLPGLVDGPLEDMSHLCRRGIFYGHLVDWGIEMAATIYDMDRQQQNQLARAVQLGYSCSKSICSEVIAGNSPHPLIDVDTSTAGEIERAVHHGVGIVTSDDAVGEPLFVGALSSGTQGTLLWIYALALKLALHYDWHDGWEDKPAILLIDEIENHLHPTWQRRVMPALLEHFPGLQIFATTHSPFVVAGLKAGQVHLLNRDDHGQVTHTTHTEDVIGWTADEILRNLMGVHEPTDQRTADQANRLRQLRDKETLTPKEERELNELRRK